MTKKVFLSLLFLIALTIFNPVQADENAKIYISEGSVYYACPDGAIKAPDDLNIDVDSVSIINDRFFKDKNKVFTTWVDQHSYICGFNEIKNADPKTFVVYNNWFQKDKNNVYTSTNYWGWSTPEKIEYLEVDSATFEALEGSYAKDKNNIYVFTNGKVKTIEGADIETFEVLSEDNNFALDKNNLYTAGQILNSEGEKIYDDSLYNNLKGKIILRVESNGEAYYIHPNQQKIHFLSRPIVAFNVMREQGLGIKNSDLEKIEIALDNLSGTDTDGDGLPDMVEDSLGTDKNNIDSDGDGYNDKDELMNGYNPTNNKQINIDNSFAKAQAGKIFLQVEKNGEAWYVNPNDNKRYFLGRPTDAFNVMKSLGLGISDINYEKLTTGALSVYKNTTYGYQISFPENWKLYGYAHYGIIASSPDQFPQDVTIRTGTPPSPLFTIYDPSGKTVETYVNTYLKDAVKQGSTYITDKNEELYFLQNGDDIIYVSSSDKNYYLNDKIFNSLKLLSE